MSEGHRIDRDGAVATVALTRPERHNALDMEDLAALTAAIETLDGPDLRALVLTGEGPKTFCSGAALGDVEGRDWTTDNPLTALCDRLERVACPTLCALNGSVYGGGAEIALACDFRIGVEGMKLKVPPAEIGIDYEPSGIARAVDRLGSQAARRIFLAAEPFGADALLAMGFVDRLVPQAELAEAAAAEAARLAGLAPLAVRGMKSTIAALSAGTLDLDEARARAAISWGSSDLKEGLAAKKEKRPPRFEGR